MVFRLQAETKISQTIKTTFESLSYIGSDFLGLKSSRRSANPSNTSSSQVKSEWTYASTPPYDFIASTESTISLTLFIVHVCPQNT